jgi:hypothetical protein
VKDDFRLIYEKGVHKYMGVEKLGNAGVFNYYVKNQGNKQAEKKAEGIFENRGIKIKEQDLAVTPNYSGGTKYDITKKNGDQLSFTDGKWGMLPNISYSQTAKDKKGKSVTTDISKDQFNRGLSLNT